MPTVVVSPAALRTHFAARLSTLYGREVPAYTTLVEVSREVNERVLARTGASAERLGSIERVTAERHGAIRVGTPREMAQVARIFAALGMYPCGFYDLRDAHPRPIPVVSTAFRPVDRDELAINPFRVFTSMLVPEDRRFFTADLQQRLTTFLDSRTLFPPELLALADRAIDHNGLAEEDAERFLELATAAFELSPEPVDRAWYTELERVSDVAADIGGVGSTHINHLTPRVLDIDDLYVSMQARGIEMIDKIQGPPAWEGPDILLRQTSFRALAEPRLFRNPDGSVTEGSLRVRFGEVEARGIALTPSGRDLYEEMTAEVARRLADRPDADHQEVAAQVWREHLPATELELCRRGLGYFTYHLGPERPITEHERDAAARGDLHALVASGLVELSPIVYEDFLPRSAAGIFASNLTGTGHVDDEQDGTHRNMQWLAGVIDCEVHVPEELYAAQSIRSIAALERDLADRLGAPAINLASTPTTSA